MSDLELWNEIGNLYYNTGAYDEAIRTYQKVIALDPRCGQSYCNLATIFVCQGRYAEAIPLFKKGIEFLDEAINKAFLWNQLGDAYRRLEDSLNATHSYRKAIELDPEDPTFHENLAEVEQAARIALTEDNPETNQAIPTPEPVVPESSIAETVILDAQTPAEERKITPESASDGLKTAGALDSLKACWVFDDKEPEQKEQEIPAEAGAGSPVILGIRILSDDAVEPVVADEPASPTVSDLEDEGTSAESSLPELSVLWSEQTGVDENIRAVARGLLRLGIMHWNKGEYARAEQSLDVALDTASRSHDLLLEALCHHAKARVESGLEKYEIAIQAYQSAANLAPLYIFPWKELGDLNCKLERYDDARAAYQEALERDPEDALCWISLGDAYHKLGRTDDAIAAYQLGNAFKEQNAEEDVLKKFEAWENADLENPQVCNEAGNIYFTAGAYTAAVASYRRAIELEPANINYLANLARAELALQRANDRNDPQDRSVTKPIQQAVVKTLAETDQTPISADRESSRKTDECRTSPAEPAPVWIDPEPIRQTNPVFAKMVSPGTEEGKPLEPDMAWIEKAEEEEPIPDALSNLLKMADEPEPEPPYWMARPTSTPANSSRQPERSQTTTLVNTVVKTVQAETVKPAPAFSIHARNSQPQAGMQTSTWVDQEQTSNYIQMAPRTIESPSPVKKVLEPITKHDWGSTLPERDAELCDTTPTPLWSRNESPTWQGFKKDGQAAAKPVQEKQVIGDDIMAYRKVTELNPKNDRAWDVLGNMYEKIGLHSDAIAAFEQAIEICPQKEAYYYHLGIALGYQAHYEKAIQALERVVEINPDYVLAHCALAGYYRRLGKEDKALEHARIAQPFMVSENEYNQACFESISGNADRALEMLGIALEKQQVQPLMICSDPDLDFIRKDARFTALLHRYGISGL